MGKRKSKKPLEKSDFVRGRKGPGVGYTKQKFPPGIDRDIDGVVKERRPKAGFKYRMATAKEQDYSEMKIKRRKR